MSESLLVSNSDDTVSLVSSSDREGNRPGVGGRLGDKTEKAARTIEDVVDLSAEAQLALAVQNETDPTQLAEKIHEGRLEINRNVESFMSLFGRSGSIFSDLFEQVRAVIDDLRARIKPEKPDAGTV